MEINDSPNIRDGFLAEFYKYFWTIISPLFIKMIDELTITSKNTSNYEYSTDHPTLEF